MGGQRGAWIVGAARDLLACVRILPIVSPDAGHSKSDPKDPQTEHEMSQFVKYSTPATML
jgi:hypothetical protein